VEVVEGRIARGAKDLFFFVFFGVVKEVQANSRCFFWRRKSTDFNQTCHALFFWQGGMICHVSSWCQFCTSRQRIGNIWNRTTDKTTDKGLPIRLPVRLPIRLPIRLPTPSRGSNHGLQASSMSRYLYTTLLYTQSSILRNTETASTRLFLI
jgi:hypothetical protein